MRIVSALSCALFFLTGCALNSTPSTTDLSGAAVLGRVMGGQQPITSANVYLLAAGATAYGGASVSLLTSGSGPDTIGKYVTTDSSGNFSITGDYTCTPGAQVYLYALGGNPGAGTNSAAGLLAALGQCPGSGSFLASTPYVVINEVSTVAAAYSFAGFATDALHVSSSGTALAKTGIANAFANAAILASISTGQSLATTPAGNGTVPQSTINTLANILAACVDSTGPASTPCSTLFADAESAGSSGTAPTDTATAAINIAHNPGTNVAALYALAASSPPFAPALAAQPDDFMLTVYFTGGGIDVPNGIAIDGSGNVWVADKATPGNVAIGNVALLSNSGNPTSPSSGYPGILEPEGIAVDSSGNAWLAEGYNSTVVEFTPGGTASSSAFGIAGLNDAVGITLDGSNNVWVPNESTSAVSELSSSKAAISGSAGYTGGGLSDPDAIAIDASGDAWVANLHNNSLTRLSSSGSPISSSSGYTGGGLSAPAGLAIDKSGNVWTANSGNNSVSKFSSTGTAISGTSGYTGGGLGDLPLAIAVDGIGNVWTANSANSITELSSAGAALSPSIGYRGTGVYGPNAIAIDGSGNIWVTNGALSNNNNITELIGAAAPVVTPIAVAVKNNTLGTQP